MTQPMVHQILRVLWRNFQRRIKTRTDCVFVVLTCCVIMLIAYWRKMYIISGIDHSNSTIAWKRMKANQYVKVLNEGENVFKIATSDKSMNNKVTRKQHLFKNILDAINRETMIKNKILHREILEKDNVPVKRNLTNNHVIRRQSLIKNKILKQRSLNSSTDTQREFTLNEMKQWVRTNNDYLAQVMNQDYLLPNTPDVLKRYLLDKPYLFTYNATAKSQLKQDYDIHSDVIVFLHVQKTGGMHLEKRLERELDPPFECNKINWICFNPEGNIWFYSMYMAGWRCGLHSDWALLHECVLTLSKKYDKTPKQHRYFFFTQLRDGVTRYLSEYHHLQRNGDWNVAKVKCGDTDSEQQGVRFCHEGILWKNLTSLDTFFACKSNLASHRLTRMLSDLTLTGCYENFTDEDTMRRRAPIWLKSAMENLQTMEYFGLMEDEVASDKLFYDTFHIPFTNVTAHEQMNAGANVTFTADQFLKILRFTELDIHLYLFGRDLFYQRLRDIE